MKPKTRHFRERELIRHPRIQQQLKNEYADGALVRPPTTQPNETTDQFSHLDADFGTPDVNYRPSPTPKLWSDAVDVVDHF